VKYNNKQTSNPLSFGLALTAGIGVIVMILALGIGVLQGETADSHVIGFTLVAGFTLLVVGFIGWMVVMRPFEHFDDINVPKDTGGHGEHAIVPHDSDSHAIESAHH